MHLPPHIARLLRSILPRGRRAAAGLIGAHFVTATLLATCGVVTTVVHAETGARTRSVAREAVIHRFDQGLLWRIDAPMTAGAPPNGSHPSHLYGTVHIDDPRATSFSASVRRALATSRVFLPELLPDEASAQAFVAATRAEPGRTLAELAGSEEFGRISDRLREHYGVPRADASRLKPWAAYVFLSQPARPMGEIVDAALIRLARQQGLTIQPLETVSQQIAAMEAVPIASQLALVAALARDHDTAMAQLDQLIELYLAQDLAGLRRLEASAVRDDPGLRQPMADFMEQILDRRNERMLNTLMPQLEAGGAFAAVGALHLTGEHGLLSLLAQAGWRVRRVD